MPISISLQRSSPFANSTAIRQDAVLFGYTQELAAWLKQRSLQTLTFAELLAFVQSAHPQAQVSDEPKYVYYWEWDEVGEVWVLICEDEGQISYQDQHPLGPALLDFKLSAQY
jgi:hypothetical protein